jgi:hypothetical protein
MQRELHHPSSVGARQCGSAFCDALLEGYLAQNPDKQQCLRPYHDVLTKTCRDAHVDHTISVEESTRRIQEIVGRACPAAQPTPPPTAAPPPSPQSVPTPPPPAAPPPSVPLDPSPLDPTPFDVTPGEQVPPPVAQPKRSPLRTWGPVVGIGLVAAVALTTLRKKK